MNPNNTYSLSVKLDCLYQHKQYISVIEVSEKYFQLNQTNSVMYLKVGISHYFRRNLDISLACMDKALQLDSQLQSVYYWKGFIYKQNKQFENAIEQFNLSIKNSYKQIECHLQIGEIQLDQKKYTEVIEELNQAFKIDQKNEETLLLKGRWLSAQKEYKEQCIAHYQECIQLYPNNVKFKYNLGREYQLLSLSNKNNIQEHQQKALQLYDLAIKINQKYILAYCCKGRILQRIDKSEAKKVMKIAAQLLEDPQALQNLSEKNINFCRQSIQLIYSLDLDLNEIQKQTIDKSIQNQINDINVQKQQLIEDTEFEFNGDRRKTQVLINKIEELKNQFYFQQKQLNIQSSQIEQVQGNLQEVHQVLDKSGAKQLADVKMKIENLMKTEEACYEYFKVFYWTLLNYFTSYRTLSTGLIKVDYENVTKEIIQEEMAHEGAKSALKLTGTLLKNIPFIGMGVQLVDSLIEFYFENAKKMEFKEKSQAIITLIQKGNYGNVQLQDDLNLLIAQSAIQITISKQHYIKTFKLKQFKINEGFTESVIKKIDKLHGKMSRTQTDLYDSRFGKLALQDVVFLLGYCYEHHKEMVESKKQLSAQFVEIVLKIKEKEEKERQKQCVIY